MSALPPAASRPSLWDGLPEVGEVRRLSLGPGDKVAVIYPERLSAYYYDVLRARLIEIWPDVPVLVLDGGPDLAVVHDERG
jgi:hypothetical protein